MLIEKLPAGQDRDFYILGVGHLRDLLTLVAALP